MILFEKFSFSFFSSTLSIYALVVQNMSVAFLFVMSGCVPDVQCENARCTDSFN